MDQIPLPFVNGQDETFTTQKDDDVNFICPKENVRKRHFIMHLVFNWSTSDEVHGWFDLVCRGKGKRVSEVEKSFWDEHIKIFWQEKVWVDKIWWKI